MCASFLDAASRYMVDVAKLFFFCLFEKTQKSSTKLPFFLKCADANLILDANLISRLVSETLMFE